jgi:hypothetical protein
VVTPPDTDLCWSHRRDDERDIYFFSNQSTETFAGEIDLRVQGGPISLYDPVFNRTIAVVQSAQGGAARSAVEISLDPGEAIFAIAEKSPVGERVYSVSGPEGLRVLYKDGGAIALAASGGTWRIESTSGRSAQVRIADIPPPVTLAEGWNATFDTAQGVRQIDDIRLRSWTEFDDPAIRFHSGIARYVIDYRNDDPGEFHWRVMPGAFANVLRVTLNGANLGTIWTPGGWVEAASQHNGVNRLEIHVANTWRNRLVGDDGLPEGERSTWVLRNRLGARDFAVLADKELLPAGLLGPVQIVPYAQRALRWA